MRKIFSIPNFKFLVLILSLSILFLNFTLIPVHSQTKENLTNQINLEIQENPDNLDLAYTITQTFNKPSRGIFLSLDKNQNGIDTKFEILKVEKSQKIEDKEFEINNQKWLKNNQNLQKLEFKAEKYEEIKEFNQLRFRVGDKNTFLEGSFQYKIYLKASKSPDYKYSFTYLKDWEDKIDQFTVYKSNQIYCSNNQDLASSPVCPVYNSSITLNQNQKNPSIWLKLWTEYKIFVISLSFIYFSIFIIWYFLTKDPFEGFSVKSPEFEPPKIFNKTSLNSETILPWQADYLISQGQINFENTLLSYLLWLNHKNYIKFKPIKIEVNSAFLKNLNERQKAKLLEIEKAQQAQNINLINKEFELINPDLPAILPEEFNKAVIKITELGLQKGLLETKFGSNDSVKILNNWIYESLKNYYSQKPILNDWTLVILVYFVLGFLFLPGIFFVQNIFLVGDSFSFLITILAVFSFPGWIFLMLSWGKLTKEGYKLKNLCQKYKFYLQKVEKYKLDFSNNPQDGIQKYLIAVPFAASFGILPKFQKYFKQIFPNNSEVDNTNNLLSSYNNLSFYTSPISSSGSSGFSGGGGFDGGGGSW
jgi:hypothetical protein